MRPFPALLLALVLLAAGSPTAAQAVDPRLRARLDAPTRAAVGREIDAARAEGLPAEPLVQKALEGATKGAPGPRIAEAVRALGRRMRTARSVAGPAATPEELVAGAAALYVGVRPEALGRLRAERAGGGVETVYAALAYLVQRGVPADASEGILRSMLRARADDADFVSLQRLVELDVRSGTPPADAARLRAGDLVRRPGGVP